MPVMKKIVLPDPISANFPYQHICGYVNICVSHEYTIHTTYTNDITSDCHHDAYISLLFRYWNNCVDDYDNVR